MLLLLWVSLGVAPPWGVSSEYVPSPAHPCPPVGSSVALGAGVSLRWLAPWVSPQLSVAGQSCRGAGLVCSVHCQCLPASPVSSDMAAGVGGHSAPGKPPQIVRLFGCPWSPHRVEPISGESERRHLWPPLSPSEEVHGAAVCLRHSCGRVSQVLFPISGLYRGMCVCPLGSSGGAGRQAVAVFQDRPHIGSPYGGAGGGGWAPISSSEPLDFSRATGY